MKIKKILCVMCALCLGAMSFCGCGKENSDKNEEATTTTTAEVEKIPETDEEWHDAMIEKSLWSYGNTTRMMNKINKAKNGEETTVAYIGGSITEGMTAGPNDCYAKLSYNYFADKFGTGDNVKFVNAGLSGTPSKLGVLRLERDVLSHNPDIVFIEFAVNDGNEGSFQGAYESMVRRLLQEDNDIAIVLLMSITENGHTAQEYMKNIAEYYQLPVISYADALTYMFENGKMTWKDFSDDQSHPNKGGHKLVCEMIAHYYDTVEAQPQEEEPAMPVAPFYSSRQEYVTMYEATDLFPSEYGSFNGQTSTAGFKNGWKYMPDGKNEPAVFEITGKFIYMIFREQSSGDLGVLDVTIRCDGEIVAETQVNGIQPSAWGDPGIQTLHMDTSVKTYTIEVKMAEGSEDKNFQILAFAATDK